MQDENGDEAEDMQQDLAAPSFEFRFECAKLLIELDETTDTAIEVGISRSLWYCLTSILNWFTSFTLTSHRVSEQYMQALSSRV